MALGIGVGAPDAERALGEAGVAAAVDGVAALPPLGGEEVAQPATTMAITTAHTSRRITRRRFVPRSFGRIASAV